MFQKFIPFDDFEVAFHPYKIIFMNPSIEENKHLPDYGDMPFVYDLQSDSSHSIMDKIYDQIFRYQMSDSPEEFCIDLRNLKMDDRRKLASVIRTLVQHSMRSKKFAKSYIINGDKHIQNLMKDIVDKDKIDVYQYH